METRNRRLETVFHLLFIRLFYVFVLLCNVKEIEIPRFNSSFVSKHLDFN